MATGPRHTFQPRANAITSFNWVSMHLTNYSLPDDEVPLVKHLIDLN